ncbi:MAG: Gx transporter family protein [Lachnospiraceae bacterium]|nr:Gx transporter family protein [Lachnospiraceae bacterium]
MRRTVELGFLLALALILSYVESLIPFFFGIPGIKLGLPNLVALLLIYDETGKRTLGAENVPRTLPVKLFTKGEREALLVNGLRIVLSGFLFSNLYAILYALAGAAFSFAAMVSGRRMKWFSMVGVSVLGGVFHNVGQLLVAMAVVETLAVAYYAPFLIVAGTVTGALLGFVGMELLPYLRRERV